VLVVAPHADDESLGCGGTLLKHLASGDELHWLLVTGMSSETGFSQENITIRSEEIRQVGERYSFSSITELMFPPARLSEIPESDLIRRISQAVLDTRPELVYTAYRNDAHSDHEAVFDAVMASTKSFRYPFIRRVLAYETISETDFGLKPEDGGFKPNVYINIEDFLKEKLDILDLFKSEMGQFPFPRSREALEALSKVRGVQCGCRAAEAFMLIKEINK